MACSCKCRIAIGAIVLTGVAIALYFEPTYSVRGWLHGEPFFDGRSATYWRSVVEKDLHRDPDEPFCHAPLSDSGWRRYLAKVGISSKEHTSVDLYREPEANAVLELLATDGDSHIAGFARDVLQLSDDDRTAISWVNIAELRCKQLLAKNAYSAMGK